MDFFELFQLHKWGNAGWLLLYAICMVLAIPYVKKHKKICWLLFVPIFVILIIYNPVFAKITYSRVFPSFLEYERLTWVMCVPIVIAFVLADFFGKLEKRRMQRLMAIFLCFLALISQSDNLIMKNGMFPDNVYKISDEVKEIADVLVQDICEDGYDTDLEGVTRSDSVYRPAVLVQSDFDAGKDGDPMYYGIRQYTSKVTIAQTIIYPDTYNAEGFSLSNYDVMNYQYFVCTNAPMLRAQAESYGFELLYETDEYVLYKNVKEYTLYFVRHGQTDANVANVFAGCGTDAMLTEEGKSQALATGEALSDIDFSAVYTSEMTRTQDTANLILSKNDYADEICAVPVRGLNDLNWGELEGLTADEVFSLYPDYSEDLYIGTILDASFVSPINAENKATVVNRFNYVMFSLVSANARSESNVLIVGHSSMQWWLQKVFDDESVEGLQNASITVLKYNRGKWELQCIGESAEEYEVANGQDY